MEVLAFRVGGVLDSCGRFVLVSVFELDGTGNDEPAQQPNDPATPSFDPARDCHRWLSAIRACIRYDPDTTPDATPDTTPDTMPDTSQQEPISSILQRLRQAAADKNKAEYHDLMALFMYRMNNNCE